MHAESIVWPLRQQSRIEACGTVRIAYVRDPSVLRVISTWDIAYRLIETLLVTSEDRDGQRIHVRVRFSELAYDEVELTGGELLAEAPCLCERIRAGEEVSCPRQEEKGLDALPHVDSLVSQANPELWATWLPKRCELRGRCNGVSWYGSLRPPLDLSIQRVLGWLLLSPSEHGAS